MNISSKFAVVVLACMVIAVLGVAADISKSDESAQQRPIQDFLDAQGTFCIDDGAGGCFLFVPPIPNYLGWSDPESELIASVDYAGLADDYITDASGGNISLGTTFEGNVTERPLDDGRTEVHVRLRTNRAQTWIFPIPEGDIDFGAEPLLFGQRADDVLDGETPALGASVLNVKFIHNAPPGAALPDLVQIVFFPEEGDELLSLNFQCKAEGELTDDNTPARATIEQVGVFDASSQGAVADGFPVERITVRSLKQ